MAKRLLFDKCESIFLEKSMISKIQMSCGNEMSKLLEGMFIDIEMAVEMQN